MEANDMQAMREAVEKLVNFLRWAYAQDCAVSRDKLADAIDIGVAALSKPPRNCDLDEVAENPEAAWLNDKDNWDEWGSPKLCIEKWLLAPAKKGG